MSKGLIGTLQFAASVVVAVPVAAFGLFKFAEGAPLLGVLFLALAVGVVVFEEAITSPTDIPAAILERVGGRVVETPEDEE
ncbi:MAG: hypothetical protein BRD23_03485 [Halobacteriales archaeon SW_9_67_25]|jgi:hypothetical protein|nr:MAG: hypothetical protein BRD23_03485 [Halobacteriales archaeon SW_9_67_25]